MGAQNILAENPALAREPVQKFQAEDAYKWLPILWAIRAIQAYGHAGWRQRRRVSLDCLGCLVGFGLLWWVLNTYAFRIQANWLPGLWWFLQVGYTLNLNSGRWKRPDYARLLTCPERYPVTSFPDSDAKGFTLGALAGGKWLKYRWYSEEREKHDGLVGNPEYGRENIVRLFLRNVGQKKNAVVFCLDGDGHGGISFQDVKGLYRFHVVEEREDINRVVQWVYWQMLDRIDQVRIGAAKMGAYNSAKYFPVEWPDLWLVLDESLTGIVIPPKGGHDKTPAKDVQEKSPNVWPLIAPQIKEMLRVGKRYNIHMLLNFHYHERWVEVQDLLQPMINFVSVYGEFPFVDKEGRMQIYKPHGNAFIDVLTVRRHGEQLMAKAPEVPRAIMRGDIERVNAQIIARKDYELSPTHKLIVKFNTEINAVSITGKPKTGRVSIKEEDDGSIAIEKSGEKPPPAIINAPMAEYGKTNGNGKEHKTNGVNGNGKQRADTIADQRGVKSAA